MFNEIYRKYIITDNFNEEKIYYKRHEYRYRLLMRIYSKLRKGPSRVLDIGGGQYGLLARKIYGDYAVVADIGRPNLYLQDSGIETLTRDLCDFYSDIPLIEQFDFIFFSEVLEHLPIPAYQVFLALKAALKPDGVIICTVPNLTSLETIFSFIFNIPVFEYFRGPIGRDTGHIIMYTKEHLRWQIEMAGFTDIDIGYKVLLKYHRSIFRNILFFIGFPLFLIPHFRTEILAVIKKEEDV